ncbi:MAG: AMP-binding protein, partial [Methylobacterium sp.]|nr:AMP-binding protein [Methylobacterium sp.]
MTAHHPEGGLARCSNRVMNLAHVLRQNARRFADRHGLVWGERSWTWLEVEREVNALAAALQARGLGKGDRLIVHSKNTAQMFFSLFAAFRLGAVWVPTNFRLMPEEVIYLAEFSGAKGFLCHGDYPDHAASVAQNVPGVEFIWRLDEQARDTRFGEADVSGRMAAFRGRTVPDAPVEHNDPCWFFFTSGTTGRSKAAVLTHGQMAFVLTNHLCDLLPGATEADSSLVVAPLSHGAGVHQLNIVARGATTILLPTEKFDIEEAWRLVEKHRVTNL